MEPPHSADQGAHQRILVLGLPHGNCPAKVTLVTHLLCLLLHSRLDPKSCCLFLKAILAGGRRPRRRGAAGPSLGFGPDPVVLPWSPWNWLLLQRISFLRGLSGMGFLDFQGSKGLQGSLPETPGKNWPWIGWRLEKQSQRAAAWTGPDSNCFNCRNSSRAFFMDFPACLLLENRTLSVARRLPRQDPLQKRCLSYLGPPFFAACKNQGPRDRSKQNSHCSTVFPCIVTAPGLTLQPARA